MPSLIFRDVRLVFPDFIAEGHLLAQGGRIAAIWIGEAPRHLPADAETVDGEGLLLAPGLVDIHNHGALRRDFVAANAPGNVEAMRFHLSQAVTHMLPTVMTETPAKMREAIQLLADQDRAGELPPNFGGIHVEGPYFNPEKRGAHLLEHLRDPDPAEYARWHEDSEGRVKIVTIAPERPGSLELCAYFHARGAVPAIGHTMATMLEIRRAGAHGARHFVHANNAVDWPGRRGRPDGWLGTEMLGVGTLLTHGAFTGEIISDGYHVPVEMIRLFLQAKGTDQMCVVSDASSATGCPEGEYELGGQRILKRPGNLVVLAAPGPDGSRPMAGSGTPLLAMVRNYLTWGFPLHTAWKMASAIPAQVIAAAGKGSLRVGNAADLVLLDDTLAPIQIRVAGRQVA